MRSLGAWQLRRLWVLAERAEQPLAAEDLARGTEPTVCKGKNHLPVFSWFEKRFAAIDGAVVGYNETGWQKLWVGAGHFTVVPSDRPAELIIDYRAVPGRTHPAFPPLRANDGLGGWPAPLRGLVYGGLVDRLRRVSPRLLIGRSDVKSPSLQAGAYFALHLPEP